MPNDVWPGPPLSEIGRAQAHQAAEFLRRYTSHPVYASPYVRTEQTAQIIAAQLGRSVRLDSELGEWRRTEALYDVSARLTRWLVRWLRAGEPQAIVVGHASPLLAILRSALYLPHANWHLPGRPDVLELSSADGFEMSMASIFELTIQPCSVTARRLFYPHPRILQVHNGVITRRPPRPPGHRETVCLQRPNWLHLIGYRGPWSARDSTLRRKWGGRPCPPRQARRPAPLTTNFL
jgi:broad specificity phosphatase PhoE